MLATHRTASFSPRFRRSQRLLLKSGSFLLAIDALTIEVPFSGQMSLRSAVGEQSDLYQAVFGSQLDVHFPTTD